jgi:hypothetical protein
MWARARHFFRRDDGFRVDKGAFCGLGLLRGRSHSFRVPATCQLCTVRQNALLLSIRCCRDMAAESLSEYPVSPITEPQIEDVTTSIHARPELDQRPNALAKHSTVFLTSPRRQTLAFPQRTAFLLYCFLAILCPRATLMVCQKWLRLLQCFHTYRHQALVGSWDFRHRTAVTVPDTAQAGGALLGARPIKRSPGA